MITRAKFLRNLEEHTRFPPFLALAGLFLGMTAMNAVKHNTEQAATWLVGLVVYLGFSGLLSSNDYDDPTVHGTQHAPTEG